jgi:hypothetical protein
MRHHRIVSIASLLALGLTLSACSTFDPTEWFNTKKPLPGDRKAVFPEGVPGVPEGVPAELVQGYVPPTEPVPEPRVIEEPKAKPRPKPRQAAPARTTMPVAQQQPQPAQQQQQQSARQAWPEAPQTPSQPASGQSQTVFPDPPRR